MKQLNIRVDQEFERELKRFMKLNSFRTKAEALRALLREASTRAAVAGTDFQSWIGVALRVPPKSKRRFLSEDDLWS